MQPCLQTSCWVVQASVHETLPPVLAALPEAAGPTTTQPFWQVAATVSQVIRQDVEGEVCGSKVGGGGGATVCAFWANAAEAPAVRSKMQSTYRIELLHASLTLYYRG